MDLLEHEAIGDVSEGGGGDLATDVATDAVADAPVVDAPAADLAADPAPQYLTAEQAAEIADARFNTLVEQYQQRSAQQTPQDPGEPLNLVDEFGQVDPEALATLLTQRDQFILEQMQQMFQPMQNRFQQDIVQQGEQRMNDIVGQLDIGDAAKDVVKQLAPMFLAETQQTWGQGSPKAAEAALAKAGQVLAQVEQDAYKRGQQANAAHLNTISNANAEPGGTAAVSQPEAGSVLEALERFKARNAGQLTAA